MSEKSPALDWFEDFFAGAALDVWRRAIPQETTDREVEFLTEVLLVKPGYRLLDLPCGNGRLSLPLANAGYKMTGVDFCMAFLDEAKQAAAKQRLEIEYVKNDMRKLAFKKLFDGAFCMGNSFGYFDRKGTVEFFKAVHKSLRIGARFVIETGMVAECFLVNCGEREWVKVDDMFMLVENNYNVRHSCVETTYTFIKGGKEEKRQAVHWIYTTGEISQMLNQAGFVVEEFFGSTDCEQFTVGAERLLVIAEKI